MSSNAHALVTLVICSSLATISVVLLLTSLQELALDAVQTVARDVGGGQREVDVKNYAKIEKIPGGTIEDCKVRQIYCSSKEAPEVCPTACAFTKQQHVQLILLVTSAGRALNLLCVISMALLYRCRRCGCVSMCPFTLRCADVVSPRVRHPDTPSCCAVAA
jgi:hypothetical protein